MDQFRLVPTSERLFLNQERVAGILDPENKTYTYTAANRREQIIADVAFRAGRASALSHHIPVVQPRWMQ